ALVFTKTDLAPVSERLARRISEINAAGTTIDAHGVEDWDEHFFGTVASLPSAPRFRLPLHSPAVQARSIVLRQPCSRLAFARGLGGLAQELGPDLLRVKGIVTFSDLPGQVAIIQGAQHTIYAPVLLECWPDEDHRSRLV